MIDHFAPYTPEDLTLLQARLRAALRLLARACPPAYRLVRGCTRTILLRRDPDHPDLYLSESTEGALGRTLLVNAHLPGVSTLQLLESLVHEALHTWLSTIELDGPFVVDRDAVSDLRLISPWTQAPLDAQRWVHAALVWVALAHLWRVAALPMDLEPERAARRATLEAALRDPRRLEALDALRPFLSEDADALLSQLLGATTSANCSAAPSA